MPRFKTLIGGMSFTECPRWHDGRLYFSDFYTRRVLAITLDGKIETIAEVPGQPSGLGFLPDGKMLIVSMRNRKVMLRENNGSLVEYADLSKLAPWHLNDMLNYFAETEYGNQIVRNKVKLHEHSSFPAYVRTYWRI